MNKALLDTDTLSKIGKGIQAVKEGLDSVARGEGRPMDDAFNALEAELRAKADA